MRALENHSFTEKQITWLCEKDLKKKFESHCLTSLKRIQKVYNQGSKSPPYWGSPKGIKVKLELINFSSELKELQKIKMMRNWKSAPELPDLIKLKKKKKKLKKGPEVKVVADIIEKIEVLEKPGTGRIKLPPIESNILEEVGLEDESERERQDELEDD